MTRVMVFRAAENFAEEMALREQVLDGLHRSLEADPYPDEVVAFLAVTPEGKHAEVRLPSLRERKRQHPSAAERRRLLGFQLADYLTALGV